MVRTKWWGVTLFSLLSMGGVLGGFAWAMRRFQENPETLSLQESPFVFLAVGLIVGLPFSIPSVLATWNELRPAKQEARRRKAKTASKGDRLKFAQDLERQIHEFSDGPRDVKGTLGGEKGRILIFKGKLSRAEGEKLVTALRSEMQELGFERVEGDGWWSRV